jgi:hypothetical protein
MKHGLIKKLSNSYKQKILVIITDMEEQPNTNTMLLQEAHMIAEDFKLLHSTNTYGLRPKYSRIPLPTSKILMTGGVPTKTRI